MINNQPLKKQFKAIIPESWDNNRKGKFWEEIIADLLRQQGWKVTERVKFTGMEIDGSAYHPDNHQKAFIEGKFYNDNPINSNIVNNLLGKAFRADVKFAYLFSTSVLNSDASGILEEEEEKNKKDPDRKPILVFYGPDKLAQLFTAAKGIELPNVQKKGIGHVEVITLLLTSEQILWVAEEIGEHGLPSRAIIFPTSENNSVDTEKLQAIFSKANIWQGLEILDGTKVKSKAYQPNENISVVDHVEHEVVLSISQADSFDDYRPPCNPKYFVGRLDLQEKFWEFVQNVREGKTDTRIFCFFGRSGLGKSSLVLKLTKDCFQKKQYKENCYLYHVDVRAASLSKSTFFVVSAIQKAIQQAIDDGFIELPGHRISIESTETPLFKNNSIELAIENIRLNNRVIVIFFDQFEYLFTKEQLSCIYELFEKIAHEVNSLKENIILGFCWRLGIIVPDTHKAYHLWHSLADKRRDVEVKEFTPEEAEALLKQFEHHLYELGQPLEGRLKRWLLDHCPGFPWLLRKLCGDIYKQILSQSDIPDQVDIKQVDIRRLFEKDLEMYVPTGKHETCLKYIAERSLVGMNELCEKFGVDVIQSLEEPRLVIRTGMNYTICWDIFREYVLEDKVPTIPLSYRPRNKVTVVLEVFKIFKQERKIELSFSELLRLSKKKKHILENIICDLANFFQFTYKHKKITAQDELLNLDDQQLADYLAKQLESHVVVIEVYAQIKPGQRTTLWGLQEFVGKAYRIQGKTKKDDKRIKKDYTSRILPWLCFAGLLEKRPNNIIIRPIDEGKQKGKVSACQSTTLKKDKRQLELDLTSS